MANWVFPIDTSDEFQGFNNMGVEHFRDHPYTSLAREVIQNSLDARRSQDEAVEVSFDLQKVRLDQVPDAEGLRKTLEACQDISLKDKKSGHFFQNAIGLLAGETIDVLSIREKNTTGIAGPCKHGEPYYTYMKAAGESVKTQATAGGSYGIGKFAPFAVSGIRAMFVSTVFKGSALEQYVQGKAILTSHKGADGNLCKHIGYFGAANFLPLQHKAIADLPEWIPRKKGRLLEDDIGTTFHVLGFDSTANGQPWELVLRATVAQNFFGAVYDGALVVTVNGHKLNKGSLAQVFKDAGVCAAVEAYGSEEDFSAAEHYVTALAQEPILSLDLEHLGKSRLRLLVDQTGEREFPSRLAILRNGMLITDRLEKLTNFPNCKPFAGVIECLNSAGNELLRAMEPPSHDGFSPDRAIDPVEQKRGRAALRALREWARREVRERAMEKPKEKSAVDELSEFFPKDDSTPGGHEMNPAGNLLKLQGRLVRPQRPSLERPGQGQGAGRGRGGGAGRGKGQGKRGSKEPAAVKFLEITDVRAIATDSRRKEYSIGFSSPAAAAAELVVQESGALGSGAELARAKVHLKSGRNHVNVKLLREFYGAVKVVIYEV